MGYTSSQVVMLVSMLFAIGTLFYFAYYVLVTIDSEKDKKPKKKIKITFLDK